MQQAAASDSDYYARLGLAGDPFATNAMPDFFFVGAQRRFLVQRAVHSLYFSGATVLLLGADGVGKTRTLNEIAKELKDLADICRIEATVLMNAGEIRSLLVETLGLPHAIAAGNIELLHALERVRPVDGDPQPVLIAIDSAQLLSVDTLAECAALVAGAGGRLRLLLAGEADLAIAWHQSQMGAAETLELKALDRNETEDYVRTILQAAGYREEPPFNVDEYDQLFARSGGNFAAINALVPALLQPAQTSAPLARRIKTLPILHIGIAAALLTIVIVLVLYRSGNSQHSSDAAVALPNSSTQQMPATKNDAEKKSIALQLPVAAAPNSVANSDLPISNTAAVETIKNEVPERKIADEPKPIVEKKPAEEKKLVVEKKTITEKKPAASIEKSSDKVSANASSALSADERALLAFPSSQYVLQLIGAESKATVDKFAKGAGKGLTLYYYRTQLRGKAWFIVVTGPYADKSAAQSALTKLPEPIRKQQPWLRSLTNVQADIRAHSGR